MSSRAIFFQSGIRPTATQGGMLFGNGTMYDITDTDNLFWDETNNRLGVGTATPTSRMQIVNTDNTINALQLTGYNNAGAVQTTFNLRASRGTPGGESAVQAGDAIFNFSAGGYGTTAFSGGRLRITGVTSENWTDAAQGAYLQFDTTPTGSATVATRLVIGQQGNVRMGASIPASNGTAVLEFEDGTAPTALGTNSAGLYANDVAGTVEMFAIDEGAAATQISPHNFSLFTPDPAEPAPWDYYSENPYTGEIINVDIAGLVRAVEALTGKTFIYRAKLPVTRDWADDQQRNARQRMHAIELWEASDRTTPAPPPPVYKAPPAYLAARIVIEPAKEAVIRAEIDAWKREKPTRGESLGNGRLG